MITLFSGIFCSTHIIACSRKTCIHTQDEDAFHQRVTPVFTVPYRDVLQSPFEVEAAGARVVVFVGLERHAGIPEDGGVVSPGRLGQVNVTWAAMETRLWPSGGRGEGGGGSILKALRFGEKLQMDKSTRCSLAYQEVGSNTQGSGSGDGLNSYVLIGKKKELCQQSKVHSVVVKTAHPDDHI